MRPVVMVLVILTFALLGLLCAPGATLEISVVEVSNGIKVENVGNIACLVFVNSLEGAQRFELAIGQSIIIPDITKPIEVSAVSK